MIRQLVRMIEKAGFAIFMFALVGVAIGLAYGSMPVVYVCAVVVAIGAAIVLVRANRAVSGKPRPHATSDGAATPRPKSSSSSRRSSISDPDRY
jgi:hypothetical protein